MQHVDREDGRQEGGVAETVRRELEAGNEEESIAAVEWNECKNTEWGVCVRAD